MEPEHLQEKSMEELLDLHLKTRSILEETEALLSVINDEMIQRLDEEKMKGKVVGEYTVTKATRLNFRPTIEQARELAAVKTVEQIDTQALKRLYEQGVEIPNTTVTSYLLVKSIQKGDATA